MLNQKHSLLETVLGLAQSHEVACKKLFPWVPNTLGRMESVMSLPSEPEAVEKLKGEVEVCVV